MPLPFSVVADFPPPVLHRYHDRVGIWIHKFWPRPRLSVSVCQLIPVLRVFQTLMVASAPTFHKEG
jgi:hypothetical protein